MVENSRKGFTLVEILVGIGLGSIVMVVAFTLIFFFNENYVMIENKIQTERALIQATYNIQRSLALAVNISDSLGAINPGKTLAPTDSGLVRNFNATTLGGNAGTVETVAMFLREKGGYQVAPTPLKGEYAPTAIFFLHPTPTKSGIIFLDVNTTGVMTPGYNDVFFERVVEFSVNNFLFSNTPVPILTSVEVSVTMRNFLSPDPNRWLFCPPADVSPTPIGACNLPNMASFKDNNRKVRVTFSNQVIDNTSPSADPSNPSAPFERTFGQMYLFPTIF